MPIVKPSLKPPKNETLQIRVEEETRGKLKKYAEFINSSESYVVSESLKLLFRKDAEFKARLENQPKNGDGPESGNGTLFETVKKA